MSSWLGAIIKTDVGFEQYSDRGAAQSIGEDIALDGCEIALRKIRDMEAETSDPGFVFAAASWLPGMLLVDGTTKRVVWYQEESELLPRLVNAAIERTWPGWTAIWSSEGSRGVLRAAGVDPKPYFTDPSFDDHSHDADATDSLTPWSEGAEDGDVFSCTMEDGRVAAWRAGYVDEEYVADAGPEKIHQLAVKVISGIDHGRPWSVDRQPEGRGSENGVHIDFAAKTFRWWHTFSSDDWLFSAFQALWPGWTLQSMGDDYEWQERLVGRQIAVPWHDCVKRLRSRLTWGARYRWLDKKASEGIDWAEDTSDALDLYNRRIKEFGDQLDKAGEESIWTPIQKDLFRFVDRLQEQPPLPPVRFIRRDGQIVG